MNGFSNVSPTDFPITCTTGYRFSFNGQEKVDEISGAGNHNTALFWEYDTRLGRRWNLDPIQQFNFSDYSVLSLNPIFNIDPLGNSSSPIFDSKTGDYLGSDSEGFDKGEVLYMDKDKYNDLSSNNKKVIEHKVAVNNSKYTNETLPENEMGMELFEKSSNTISRALYLRYEKERPSLKNNSIEAVPIQDDDIARYETATPTEDGGWKGHQIKFNFNQRKDYLNTPGNIFTTFLHEYKGHGVLNLQNSDHIKIYQMQHNHASFNLVTGRMRQHVESWIK